MRFEHQGTAAAQPISCTLNCGWPLTAPTAAAAGPPHTDAQAPGAAKGRLPVPHRADPPHPRQVDDRLATEGTGKILGINDPALFWALAGVFTLVWAVFYTSTRDLGGDKGDDSGACGPLLGGGGRLRQGSQ